MSRSLGAKIQEKRKEKAFTQEELAEKLGVSAQAVSKWENDISCPDIMLLPTLAKLLGATVDELLSNEEKKTVELVPQEKRRSIDEMMLRINVNSAKDSDKVRVNIPLTLFKVMLDSGAEMQLFGGTAKNAMGGVDMKQLYSIIESGVIGKIMEVETGDGDTVDIYVE